MKRAKISTLIYFSIALGPVACMANDGQLITSFATSGVEQIEFFPNQNIEIDNGFGTVAPAVQSDGKIVIEAAVNNGTDFDFGVLRLNADGSLDRTFGPAPGGQVVTSFNLGGTNNDIPNSVIVDGSGRILVAGSVDGDETTDGADCGIIRLTPDGALDTSFSGDGKATIGFDVGPAGERDDLCLRVKLQNDGKILLVGAAQTGVNSTVGTTTRMAIARLTTSGTRDTTFNGDGLVTIDFGSAYVSTRAFSASEQSDGSIVIVGGAVDANGYPNHAIARVTASGALDTSFGNGGTLVFTTGINGYAAGEGDLLDIAMLPDDAFVVAGVAYTSVGTISLDYFFAKFFADGSLDPAFGNGGRTVVPFDLGGSLNDHAAALTMDREGRFIANGFTQTGASSAAMGIARLTPDGQLDATFGELGTAVVQTNSTEYREEGLGISMTPDGRILVTSAASLDSAGTQIKVGVAELVDDTLFSDRFEN